jgi:hypothetical protein
LFARRRHSDFSLKLYIHCSMVGKYFFLPDHFAKTSTLILYEIPRPNTYWCYCYSLVVFLRKMFTAGVDSITSKPLHEIYRILSHIYIYIYIYIWIFLHNSGKNSMSIWFVIFKYLLCSCNLTRIPLVSSFAPSFLWFEPSLYVKVEGSKSGIQKPWNFEPTIN